MSDRARAFAKLRGSPTPPLYFLRLVRFHPKKNLNVFTKQQTGKVSDTVKCERCRADVQLAASYDCTRD